MTLLLCDNEQRVFDLYREEPHIADLFMSQLSHQYEAGWCSILSAGGIFQSAGNHVEWKYVLGEMLSSWFPIMRSSGFRPGPPANRRCAIRRSMPVINDVQRPSISQILPGRLALPMSWTAEICSYKPYEEGKHMTTLTVYVQPQRTLGLLRMFTVPACLPGLQLYF